MGIKTPPGIVSWLLVAPRPMYGARLEADIHQGRYRAL